jgi:ribokinase
MTRVPAALLDAADVIVVNETEARALGRDLGAADDIGVARALGGAHRTVIITRGAAGALALDRGTVHVRAAPVVTVVDTVGAGDAFTGVLAAALDGGAPLELALPQALAAGALACTARGAQPAMPGRDAIARLAATL